MKNLLATSLALGSCLPKAVDMEAAGINSSGFDSLQNDMQGIEMVPETINDPEQKAEANLLRDFFLEKCSAVIESIDEGRSLGNTSTWVFEVKSGVENAVPCLTDSVLHANLMGFSCLADQPQYMSDDFDSIIVCMKVD